MYVVFYFTLLGCAKQLCDWKVVALTCVVCFCHRIVLFSVTVVTPAGIEPAS
jgi:hypothetical protein